MLEKISENPIIKVLACILFLILGLNALVKGELFVRGVKEPIKGIPARVIGFFICSGTIAGAFLESKNEIVFYTYGISLVVVVTMGLLFSFINWFKQYNS